MDFKGMTIGEWNRLLNKGDEGAIKAALKEHVGIEDLE